MESLAKIYLPINVLLGAMFAQAAFSLKSTGPGPNAALPFNMWLTQLPIAATILGAWGSAASALLRFRDPPSRPSTSQHSTRRPFSVEFQALGQIPEGRNQPTSRLAPAHASGGIAVENSVRAIRGPRSCLCAALRSRVPFACYVAIPGPPPRPLGRLMHSEQVAGW